MAGPITNKVRRPCWTKASKTIGGHIMMGGLRSPFTACWRPPSTGAKMVKQYVVTSCGFSVWLEHVFVCFLYEFFVSFICSALAPLFAAVVELWPQSYCSSQPSAPPYWCFMRLLCKSQQHIVALSGTLDCWYRTAFPFCGVRGLSLTESRRHEAKCLIVSASK
jgi:hypothetical protein